MGIKSLDDLLSEGVTGRGVLVRSDLNVPVDDDGNITDPGRIIASVPTLKALSDAGAKVVVTAHLGRPKGAPDPKFSLGPVAAALGDQRVHNGTKPTILTPEALAALKERIKAPPDDGGLWTGPKIARWLARFHGVRSVHDQRGWDALIAIGYSIQQPRPRHQGAARHRRPRVLRRDRADREHRFARSRSALRVVAIW